MSLRARSLFIRAFSATKKPEPPRSPHRPDGYGMAEDWKEAGRAVRDRAGEVAKETIKAGSDALKAATTGSAFSPDKKGPADKYPPSYVNNYGAAENAKEMADKAKDSGKTILERIKDKVSGIYEKIESVGKVDGSEDAPADGPDARLIKPEDYGIKEKETKEAFRKGQKLMERESMKGG